MPLLINKPIVPQNNVDILNAIRKYATTEYQSRIPEATKATIKASQEQLLSNPSLRNEFVDALVNRIGMVIFRQGTWNNPFAIFKQGLLTHGDTIEEINVGLVKAKTYDANRQQLEGEIFGTELPDVQASYHKVNRQNYYKISVNTAELAQAFIDDFGLFNLVSRLMQAPNTSDQWDEFLLMSSLFREYFDNDGFYRVHVPDLSDVESDSAEAKYALRRMREFTGKLPYISTKYNAAGMPVSSSTSEMVLFITEKANAAMDVEALAAAFNVSYAEFDARKIVVPEEYFRIPGVQAILADVNFFVCADQRFETTQAINPVTLVTNYFLHHWEVISASRFVNAIMFWTGDSTEDAIVDTPVTDIETPTIVDADGNVVTKVIRGEDYQVSGLAVTTGDNDAVVVTVTGALSPLTRVTQTGVLRIGRDEPSEAISVWLVATDNPDIPAKKVDVTVAGDLLQLWPDPQVIPDADQDALLEVTPKDVPAAPTSGTNKNKVTIPNTKGVDYKDGSTIVSGKTITLTANKTITATAQTGYEIAPGATTTWNLVYTA